MKIRGKVTQEDNEPLEFVTIRISGTSIGTMSGLDGTYQLNAPDSDTIRITFSCIGYEEAKRRLVAVKDSAVVNVKMSLIPYSWAQWRLQTIRSRPGKCRI